MRANSTELVQLHGVGRVFQTCLWDTCSWKIWGSSLTSMWTTGSLPKAALTIVVLECHHLKTCSKEAKPLTKRSHTTYWKIQFNQSSFFLQLCTPWLPLPVSLFHSFYHWGLTSSHFHPAKFETQQDISLWYRQKAVKKAILCTTILNLVNSAMLELK